MKQTISKIFGKKDTQNVLFPITKTEFDELCFKISDEFDLPHDDTTRDWLATAILHAPAGVAAAPISYFGSFVRKGISNTCCFEVTQNLKKKRLEAAEKTSQENKVETSTETSDSKPVSN